MTTHVHSLVQSLADIIELRAALTIPSYQRPYVWPSDDATKLLDDINNAMRDGSQSFYYIGTVLTSETKAANGHAAISYELIDGQQRMTTLMLLALAFCRVLPGNALTRVTTLGKAPRLRFAIRARVQQLLGHWAGLDNYQSPGDEAIAKDAYLTQMHATLAALEQALRQIQQSENPRFADLADYLFHRVRWVNNVLPASIDLNRIFATANTAGVQLEQSDMLKARLMKKIFTGKIEYEAIWQVCERMDNYFERNVRAVFPNAAWSTLLDADLIAYSSGRFATGANMQETHTGMSIATLAATAGPAEVTTTSAREDDRNVYCTPIISFALLLMHTYRIFRARQDAWGRQDITVRMNETRLSECFSEFVEHATEAMVKRFIECLWEVRYQFDRWVVKWVKQAEKDERQLRLTSVGFSASNGGRLSRSPIETSNLSQLESVRYFTGERSAQYWLTPFLGRLIAAQESTREEVDTLLERIDNDLSLTTRTQKEASFALLDGDVGSCDTVENKLAILKKAEGTGFEHYWFQKLEYVLWREQTQMSCFTPEKLKTYRIASRNSVEHVHPQNEQYERKLDRDVLDNFGNLVLLSPSENSSYSNKPVGVKRAEFTARPRYESLKLAHMFASMGDTWNADQVDSHQHAMIDLLRQHYFRTAI